MPSSSKPDSAASAVDPRIQAHKACKRQAMDLLARREHSRLELERKLAARAFDPEIIVQSLDQLESEGLLVQTRFAEQFIRSRALKGQGPVRVRAELLRRGIADEEATELLATSELDWAVLASEARIKRFGAASPASFKERARQAKFLQYRGFETSQIEAALDLAADSD